VQELINPASFDLRCHGRVYCKLICYLFQIKKKRSTLEVGHKVFTVFLNTDFLTFSVKMYNKKFTENSDRVLEHGRNRSESATAFVCKIIAPVFPKTSA